MQRIHTFLVSLMFVFVVSSALHAESFEIDPEHSSVTFKIRSWFFHTEGKFKEFQGVIEYDPSDFSTWSTNAAIQAASIDTGIAKRDKHLRSDDFFNVEKFPTITFKSIGVTKVTETSAHINGELTLHGVTKPVVLNLERDKAKDAKDESRVHFIATTSINRKDFGISWSRAAEGGGLTIGHKVKILIQVEAIQKT